MDPPFTSHVFHHRPSAVWIAGKIAGEYETQLDFSKFAHGLIRLRYMISCIPDSSLGHVQITCSRQFSYFHDQCL